MTVALGLGGHQGLPGAPEPRHDGADRHAGHLRDILVGKLFEFMQHETLAQVRRQRGQRLVELCEALGAREGCFGVVVRVGDFQRDRLAIRGSAASSRLVVLPRRRAAITE